MIINTSIFFFLIFSSVNFPPHLTLLCRALLTKLITSNHWNTKTAYAHNTLFMAVGNVVGSAAVSSDYLHRALPFTKTKGCDDNCANVKLCFFSVTLLAGNRYMKEKPHVVLEKQKGLGSENYWVLCGCFRCGHAFQMGCMVSISGYNNDWM